MKVILKFFNWLSGLIVVFLGAYITGVITLLIPPPERFLCSIGLGFCPGKEIVEFLATDPDRILDSEGVGQAPGETQIGMLHNSVVKNDNCKPNSVEYQFLTKNGGRYDLRVLYAAFESRPVEILINNQIVASNMLSKITKGWQNQHREWSDKIPLKLKSGKNTLLLRSNSCFPHLSRFRLMQSM